MADIVRCREHMQQPLSRPGEKDTLEPGTTHVEGNSQTSAMQDRSHVVLHFDFMSDSTTQAATAATLSASVLGVAILIAEMVIKYKQRSSTPIFRQRVSNCNTAASGLCVLLLFCNLAVFSWRVVNTWRSKKRWTLRQQRSAILIFAENVVQCINLTFYTMPNVYLIKRPCGLTDSFILWCIWARWTCWNTLFMLFLVHAYGSRVWRPAAQLPCSSQSRSHRDHTELDHLWYLDGPWRLFWPVVLPWCCLEAAVSYTWLHANRGNASIPPLCNEFGAEIGCPSPQLVAIGIYTMVALCLLYFVITCGILLVKLRALNSLPYDRYQGAIVFYRLQLRLRTVLMIFYTLCLVLFWYVASSNCASLQFTWMGIMPMQVVTTVHIFVMTLLAMPHNPSDHAIAMKMWQQQFAWTEARRDAKLVAQAVTRPSTDKLARHPPFCVETMMHLLYFSCLIYDYNRAPLASNASQGISLARSSVSLLFSHPAAAALSESPTSSAQSLPTQTERTTLSLPTALSLYDLTDSKLFTELQTDTRCLVTWNATKIVITFRGTASLKNAKADLQAWRVAHPPVRGRAWACSRPMVHAGFMRCWRAGGLNLKVLDHVRQLVQQYQHSQLQQDLKIYVTGHSLGGALAVVATFDIARELRQANVPRVHVSCYTFGAPRVGNSAFATEYDQLVTDTWSIVNDQDLVTRGGKFLFLYTRCGRRVIINAGGHMMVAPSSFEAWIQQHTVVRTWQHHLLTDYYHSTLAVLLAQFSHKGFADGMQGVTELAEASPFLQNLMEAQMGMRLPEMRQLVHNGCRRTPGCNSLTGAHMPALGFYQRKNPQPVTVV